MLIDIKLRNFRCFDALECKFASTSNVICGPNAQGKTSLLEAVCVLLRLQSPRISTLAYAIQHGKKGFVIDGHFDPYHMQFYYGRERKKLALDSVEQKSAAEYLEKARLVYFSNQDIDIVRGPAENRRRFLDFTAMQIDPGYRRNLRSYEKALRSRNALLKGPKPKWTEISAFNGPLITAGNYITTLRSVLLERLQPSAREAHQRISNSGETLSLGYVAGAKNDFEKSLEHARTEDLRLRQTSVGPHRDDILFHLNDQNSEFASEGQQRTAALSLRLAQANLIEQHWKRPPLLLMDDIFGELDLNRRNALLHHLPAESQKIITTTDMKWMQGDQIGQVIKLP